MKHLQIAIRRWLGLPTQKELYECMASIEADTISIHAAEARVRSQTSALEAMEANLKATEARINSRFKELEKAEAQMQQIAADMTLALYDAVEKIMAEIAEAKRTLESEQSNDK